MCYVNAKVGDICLCTPQREGFIRLLNQGEGQFITVRSRTKKPLGLDKCTLGFLAHWGACGPPSPLASLGGEATADPRLIGEGA